MSKQCEVTRNTLLIEIILYYEIQVRQAHKRERPLTYAKFCKKKALSSSPNNTRFGTNPRELPILGCTAVGEKIRQIFAVPGGDGSQVLRKQQPHVDEEPTALVTTKHRRGLFEVV